MEKISGWARALPFILLHTLATLAVAAPDEDKLGKVHGYPIGTTANGIE